MEKEHRVIGILAHVDAGKTTLAEAILYTTGVLREAGRVDHQDAFLDHYAIERQRGITVFSKQALFSWKAEGAEELDFTLLDTPGHVDFSAEMERTLQVLDYAVLVISGADGVQGHTRTLWSLLRRYEIPTFLFVNKMDQEGTDAARLLTELQNKLDEACICFSNPASVSGAAGSSFSAGSAPASNSASAFDPGSATEAFYESLSLCDERLMEEYLETGRLCEESIAQAVADRKIFPTYFGSALRLYGVKELLDGLVKYSLPLVYPVEFGARVFKISRDKQGNRLTHLKVTGGVLRAKQVIDGEDKADQLRLYNGQAHQILQEVPAGRVCAVTGLPSSHVGQGFGIERGNVRPSLEPVLTYGLRLPEGYDPVVALGQLRRIEEEDPMLRVIWQEAAQKIHVSVMGEVQAEILQTVLQERYGLTAKLENGSIVYKETLAEPVIGVGHYEPLRHYAEVQLLLAPAERGSGLTFESLVSEDDLDKNWQRLILTHLMEQTHPGVLLGGEVTDLHISILDGRAHIKHTEGGDFRQATYRAVRQGLRNGRSILLEPIYEFTLEVPTECLGRAMTDLSAMQGKFDAPVIQGESATLLGTVPASCFAGYQREMIAYTKGMGKLSYVLKGFEPCHNTKEVLKAHPYDPDADLEHPTFSVFCSHGAGTPVPWDQVYGWAHLPLKTEYLEAAKSLQEKGTGAKEEDLKGLAQSAPVIATGRSTSAMPRQISTEEIDAIFAQGSKNQNRKGNDLQGYRRYHRGARRVEAPGSRTTSGAGATSGGGTSSSVATQDPGATSAASASGTPKVKPSKPPKILETCMLVDGYNIIHAWPELRDLMQVNMGSARDRLIREMSDYQGYVGGILILVFDAYKVKGNPETVESAGNIFVVYTKEAETADRYIERTVHQMASKYQITVATSDGLEQMIIWGDGASRMSATGLKADLEQKKKLAREAYGITEHFS